jgi:hypothetical protein
LSDEDHSGRPSRTALYIGLAVLGAVLVGIGVGFLVSRSGGGEATATTTVAPTTTTTAIPTTTLDPNANSLEVTASEDTHVDAAEPGVGHGAESTLKIENDPPEVSQALIRFEVAGIPEGADVSQAVLRLTVERESEAQIEVRLVAGSWDDSTTWADAPVATEVVGTILPGTPEGSVVEADISAAVDGNGIVEIFLTTESDDSSEFGSADSSSPPRLAVAWNGVTLVSPPPEASAPTTTPDDSEEPDESEPPATGGSLPITTEELELTGDHAVLVGAGDIADCDNDGAETTATLVEGVIADDPDALVFTAGDNAYENGTVDEFAECFHPTWGRFKEAIRPSIGNHDLSSDDSPGYFSYFGATAGDPEEGFYSYEAGSWLVVVLNTLCGSAGGCELESPQGQWLAELLDSSDHVCTLAVYHHPMFSSGEHGGEDDARDLFDLLYAANADVVINGHDHNYERFAPQDPDGDLDLARGIRQFVVGTGGKGADPIPGVEPNSEVRIAGTLGILQLKLYDVGYEWEFIPEPGSNQGDVGANSCH